MSILNRFKNISEADKSKAVEKLIKESTPDFDFFFFMVLSFFVVTLGLLIGSTAVVIGAMLIAPILYPILSFSQGVVMSDQKLMQRSLSTILISMAIGIGVALVIAFLTPKGILSITSEIEARTNPSLFQFAIAVVTGLAVCYALVKGEISEALPGVAVSVTLLPPLAVVGIGMGLFNWEIASGALLVFIINVVGVMFAALLTFSLMNFYAKRQIAENTLKKEEERVEEEEKKVEQMEEEQERSGEEENKTWEEVVEE